MNFRKVNRFLYLIVVLVVGFVGGLVASQQPFIRMVVNDPGHALFGVATPSVQTAVIDIVHRYTGLKPFMQIDSGKTHQIVLSDSITVIATMDDPRLPHSGRMFIVNDSRKRYQAAHELVDTLNRLGYHDTTIVEPDPALPKGTMLLVVSPHALPGGGIGFRPEGKIMKDIAPPSEAKFL